MCLPRALTGRAVYLLLKFSYNNRYQASLQMSPFEVLYVRKCRTPLMWSEVGERTLFKLATIMEAEENVSKVRELKDCSESLEELHRQEEEILIL